MNATMEFILSDQRQDFTFEEVAQKANVNRTTLYRRWKSKPRLIAWAMLEHQNTNLPDCNNGSLEEDFVELMMALDVQLNGPLGKWFINFSIFEAAKDPAVAEAMQTFWEGRLKAVSVLIDRAIERKEVSPDIDALFFIEQVFGAYYFRLIRGVDRPLTEEDAHKLVRHALTSCR